MNKPKNFDVTSNTAGNADDKPTRDEILEALDYIPADDYNDWIGVGAALKREGFSVADWDKWSATAANYSPELIQKKWNSFTDAPTAKGNATDGAAIMKKANIYGYRSHKKHTKPDCRADATPQPPQPALMMQTPDDYKFYVLFDSVEYKQKPASGAEVRQREQLQPEQTQYSIDGFTEAVTSGRTFYPSIWRKVDRGRRNARGGVVYDYDFIGQQLFVVDIDNDESIEKGKKRRIENPENVDTILQKCERHGLRPFLIYETFSSKQHREDAEQPYCKYRVCFCLDTPLLYDEWGEQGAILIRRYVSNIFGKAADTSVTDTARLVYGTAEGDRALVFRGYNVINKKKMLDVIFSPAAAAVANIARTAAEALPADMVEESAQATTQPAERTTAPAEGQQTEQGAEVQTSADTTASTTPAAEQAPAIDTLDAFIEKIQTEAYKPIATNLPFFDDFLSGGVIPQTLCFLMAAPGSGKTSLAQQLAEAMAAHEQKVIYMCLEMSVEQLLSKTISSRLAKKKKGENISALDILQGYKWTPEQKQIILDEIEAYRNSTYNYIKYNPRNLSTNIDDILSYLKKIGDAAKEKGESGPVIVLDYLHLCTGRPGEDTKDLLSRALKGLKDYCVVYDTFCIAISAVNRISSKSGQITLESGRDSSNIEYSGDYAISLNFYDVDKIGAGHVDPNNENEMAKLKAEKWRRMILRVVKSRFCPAGRFARVYFHTQTSTFYGENDFMPADSERRDFDGGLNFDSIIKTDKIDNDNLDEKAIRRACLKCYTQGVQKIPLEEVATILDTAHFILKRKIKELKIENILETGETAQIKIYKDSIINFYPTPEELKENIKEIREAMLTYWDESDKTPLFLVAKEMGLTPEICEKVIKNSKIKTFLINGKVKTLTVEGDYITGFMPTEEEANRNWYVVLPKD